MNELDKGKQNQLLLRKGAIAKLREKIDKAASMSSHSNEERRQRDAKTKENPRATGVHDLLEKVFRHLPRDLRHARAFALAM
eukprot:1063723-Amorphochlora_amoeboformis.AAC.2